MSVATPEIYRHDRFIARRKVFKLFGGAFTIFGLDGSLLAASEQKAFKLKEDIRVNDGSPDGTEILQIKADRIVDFSAAYKVTDSLTGEHIGTLRRKGWTSLFRDSWEILDAEGVVRGKVMEESPWKAAVRRTVELAAMLLPQAFLIEIDGQVVATMRQNFNIFVHKFDVDLTPDTEGMLPRPLALATVILLLAIEGRQG
jgi:hypothetical protein